MLICAEEDTNVGVPVNPLYGNVPVCDPVNDPVNGSVYVLNCVDEEITPPNPPAVAA